MIELKRELCTKKVSTFLPASLAAKLRQYQAEKDVTESAAVRYVLSLFFSVPDNEIEAFVKEKEVLMSRRSGSSHE